MRLLVDHADEQEQRSRAQAVVDHLQDGAFHALRVEREHTEHDKTEVADRGVRDQFFHVRLRVRNRRAVNDADGREQRDPRGGFERGFGEERNVEAQETVRSHFQQDTRQDDRTSRGRFHVRVGQPGVQRPHRDFDGEGGGEGQE